MSAKMDKLSQLHDLVNKMVDDAMAEARKPENEHNRMIFIGQVLAYTSIANHIIDMQDHKLV